jgi:hypothetical protein
MKVMPYVRRIELSDLGEALAKGLDEFAAYRTDVIFLVRFTQSWA